MIPAPVRDYREEWAVRLDGAWVSGWAHLALTSLGSLAAIAFAASRVRSPSAGEWLIVPVWLLVANLVEYLMHRGPMHRRVRPLGVFYERHAQEHHRYFTHESMAAAQSRQFRMVLFPPITIFVFLGVIGTPLALLVGAAVSHDAGWLSFATSVAYFLSYEWLHLSYHLPDNPLMRLPVLSAMRRHHTAHHDPALMSRWNFNVNFPICDELFGTRWRG